MINLYLPTISKKDNCVLTIRVAGEHINVRAVISDKNTVVAIFIPKPNVSRLVRVNSLD